MRRSPLSREHSRVSKSTDFIISVKRSRYNAKNSDPWTRLTQPVNLNNQTIGIGYRLHLVTSAAEKADLFFSPRTARICLYRNCFGNIPKLYLSYYTFGIIPLEIYYTFGNILYLYTFEIIPLEIYRNYTWPIPKLLWKLTSMFIMSSKRWKYLSKWQSNSLSAASLN